MLFVDRDQEQDGFFWVRRFPQAPCEAPDYRMLQGYTGFFEFDGVTQSDLFVGSGELRLMHHLDQEQMVNAFSRRGEICVIPGSSWKGAVRLQVELFTPSCFTDKDQQCECPACSLFGKLGYRGRVSFDESRIRDITTFCREIIQRTEPIWKLPRGEENPVFRKLYSRDFSERQVAQTSEREYIEAIPDGTPFIVRLRFQNLERWEMGLLLFALGVSGTHPFDFKMGGAKNRGLGVIRLSWRKGAAEESVEWMFRERKPKALSRTERENLIEEYLTKAERNGIRAEVLQIAERLRKEYRRDA